MKNRNTMPESIQGLIEMAKHDPSKAYTVALVLESSHKNPEIVQYYYQRAANAGYTPAMVKIAQRLIPGMYQKDRGEDAQSVKDISEGIFWLNRASLAGDYVASYLMARIFWDGIGVGKSRSKAQSYLLRINFPYAPANPYEDTEVLFFGSANPELNEYVTCRENVNHLSPVI